MRNRYENPVTVLVTIANVVTATTPQVPPSLAIWGVVANTTTKRLRTLLMREFIAHPDRLVSGASDASMPAQRMIRELKRRGIRGLVLPRCARCGRSRSLPHLDESGGRHCAGCHRIVASKRCSTCGEVRNGYRLVEGIPYCVPCFRADPRNHVLCSGCGSVDWVRAQGPSGPLCGRCYRPPELECARCGRIRRPAALIEGDPICLACYNSVRKYPRACEVCGVRKLTPYRREGLQVCAACAGEEPYVRCDGCGSDRSKLYGPLCATCSLPGAVETLISDANGQPHPQLISLGQYLLSSPTSADSRLNWVTRGVGASLIRRMAVGELAVSLRAVAELRADIATEYVAALLMESGAVQRDDFTRIRFEVWQEAPMQFHQGHQ